MARRDETDMSQDRIGREAAFHDDRFTDDSTRAQAGKFYATTQRSKRCYRDAVTAAASGADIRVLEYGCGAGGFSGALTRVSESVHAMDLSVAGLRAARGSLGSSPSPQYCAMDAERLGYQDSSFDLLFGSGILHHLELETAMQEVGRVLKPEGEAVFFEPLGHNVLINLYRRLTPAMRTVDEHPLRRRDLLQLRSHFGRVHVRYFHLLGLVAAPLCRTPVFAPVLGLLDLLDRALLALPLLRLQAWVVVIQVAQPRKQSSVARPPVLHSTDEDS
jgi:SAM-dependent methyltransferase